MIIAALASVRLAVETVVTVTERFSISQQANAISLKLLGMPLTAHPIV